LARVDITLYDQLPGVGSLGRHREHDSRSWDYALVEPRGFAIGDAKPVLWERYSPILDQGRIGSCTGNAMAGWLGCAPHCSSKVDATQYDEGCAVALYSLATRIDKIPGYYAPADPDSVDTGSTGNAVAKAARNLHLIGSYGWAFTTVGLLWRLQHQPVLVGSVWKTGMDRPDADGFVSVTGTDRGGHEYLVRGYQPGARGQDGYLVADNSWSERWGDKGSFKIRLSDWETLRAQQADVTVPKI
jgi:hypothetical protein